MDFASGTFQIRPFKEFMAFKGRDGLLSLTSGDRLFHRRHRLAAVV